MAPKDINMTATVGQFGNLKFWCLYVLFRSFVFLCWSGFIFCLEFYMNVYSDTLFCKTRYATWILMTSLIFKHSLFEWSLGSSFEDDDHYCLDHFSTGTMVPTCSLMSFTIHPSHALTYIYFTDMSREASQCWEEKFIKATVRLYGTAKSEKVKKSGSESFLLVTRHHSLTGTYLILMP